MAVRTAIWTWRSGALIAWRQHSVRLPVRQTSLCLSTLKTVPASSAQIQQGLDKPLSIGTVTARTPCLPCSTLRVYHTLSTVFSNLQAFILGFYFISDEIPVKSFIPRLSMKSNETRGRYCRNSSMLMNRFQLYSGREKTNKSPVMHEQFIRKFAQWPNIKNLWIA